MTLFSFSSHLRLGETREKRIIILSIHQPRYSIFSLFSSLTLLSRGQVVYHGPTQQVLPYFDSLGTLTQPTLSLLLPLYIVQGFLVLNTKILLTLFLMF